MLPGNNLFAPESSRDDSAEEDLRLSAERFRAAVSITGSLIWTNTAEGMMEGEQPGWGNFTGQSQEEYQGYGWSHAVHPDDAQPTILAWQQAVAGKRVFEFEHRVRRRDGEWRLCSIRAVPLLDADGTIREWVGVHTDITERKRAEEALRSTHQRLETVLASITDGLAVLDKNWRYTYFSEQAARIIGMRADELLGRCVWDLFPAAEGTKFSESYHRAVATGEKVEFEEFYPEPINKWLECHCYPSAEGLSVYFHDVTARKQAEETLKQNQSLFSTIIEQAPGGVYVVDEQFRTMKVNALARPTFAAAEPVIGRDFREVMHILWGPEVGGELADIFRNTLDTGERYVSPRFAAHRTDLGADKAYDWEVQRLILPNGKYGAVCYFSDVTAQYELENALRIAKEAAEAANQSKDHFLAVLSHELRTPLTPVLMTVAALENDGQLPADVLEDLAMIKRNVELETKLIDDLLDLSRITSGKIELKMERIDLNETVRQVCGICGPQLNDQNVRLESDLAENAGFIEADTARLQQVLWNIIKNAVKFTPSGSWIRISTARLSSDLCEVRVTDSGIGIHPDVLPRIFNAFEQGDAQITRQFGGLGLGLAISRALVELLGGRIRAESEGTGLGATFIVELPGTAATTVSDAHGAAYEESAATSGVRLLLVEDHRDTAQMLSRLLRSAGFTVAVASDVASAIAAFGKDRFDVLISDLGLPDGDGFEIMRAIRCMRIVPGIAMSGYGMEDDLRRSTEAGFTEHLVKPISVPSLIAAIRRVTENRD
jgi:PAS domain S-box-containing protein